jgi:hypothetical protein
VFTICIPFLFSIYIHQEPLLTGYDNARVQQVPLCLYTTLFPSSDSIFRSQVLYKNSGFARGQSVGVVCVLVGINYFNCLIKSCVTGWLWLGLTQSDAVSSSLSFGGPVKFVHPMHH